MEWLPFQNYYLLQTHTKLVFPKSCLTQGFEPRHFSTLKVTHKRDTNAKSNFIFVLFKRQLEIFAKFGKDNKTSVQIDVLISTISTLLKDIFYDYTNLEIR